MEVEIFWYLHTTSLHGPLIASKGLKR